MDTRCCTRLGMATNGNACFTGVAASLVLHTLGPFSCRRLPKAPAGLTEPIISSGAASCNAPSRAPEQSNETSTIYVRIIRSSTVTLFRFPDTSGGQKCAYCTTKLVSSKYRTKNMQVQRAAETPILGISQIRRTKSAFSANNSSIWVAPPVPRGDPGAASFACARLPRLRNGGTPRSCLALAIRNPEQF